MLAQLARGNVPPQISDLEEALEVAEFFTPEHAALLAAMLARINQVTEEIARLTEVVERLLDPYRGTPARRCPARPAAPPGRPRGTGPDVTRSTRATCPPRPAHAAGQPVRQAQQEGRVQEGQPGAWRVLGETTVAPAAPRPAKAPATGAADHRRGKAEAQVAVGDTQRVVDHGSTRMVREDAHLYRF